MTSKLIRSRPQSRQLKVPPAFSHLEKNIENQINTLFGTPRRKGRPRSSSKIDFSSFYSKKFLETKKRFLFMHRFFRKWKKARIEEKQSRCLSSIVNQKVDIILENELSDDSKPRKTHVKFNFMTEELRNHETELRELREKLNQTIINVASEKDELKSQEKKLQEIQEKVNFGKEELKEKRREIDKNQELINQSQNTILGQEKEKQRFENILNEISLKKSNLEKEIEKLKEEIKKLSNERDSLSKLKIDICEEIVMHKNEIEELKREKQTIEKQKLEKSTFDRSSSEKPYQVNQTFDRPFKKSFQSKPDEDTRRKDDLLKFLNSLITQEFFHKISSQERSGAPKDTFMKLPTSTITPWYWTNNESQLLIDIVNDFIIDTQLSHFTRDSFNEMIFSTLIKPSSNVGIESLINKNIIQLQERMQKSLTHFMVDVSELILNKLTDENI